MVYDSFWGELMSEFMKSENLRNIGENLVLL